VAQFFLSKGYKLFIWKIWNLEVDFIVEKAGRKIYIQVAYVLWLQETTEREYASLRKVKDSFEKYVISLDDLQLPTDDMGIKHLQLWKMGEVF